MKENGIFEMADNRAQHRKTPQKQNKYVEHEDCVPLLLPNKIPIDLYTEWKRNLIGYQESR